MASKLFRTKPIYKLIHEAHYKDQGLKKALNSKELVALGIGAIIGAGIFVLSGQAAAQYAGPAIVISFIISAVACALAGLCYAEFASMIPISGSAYTYAYASLGELAAWIIGWDLVLEYLFAASTVAVGWSGYVVSFLKDVGIHLPIQYTVALGTKMVNIPGEGWKQVTEQLTHAMNLKHIDIHSLPMVTGIINVPAMLIVALVTILLIRGVKESASFNNVMVVIKLLVIVLLIIIGFAFVKVANWHPFIPPNLGEFGKFGWSGILRGAGVIFFAYIGFDAVSTAAAESKKPQRDMPMGILGSLGISTMLYILVALVLTGLVSYTMLNVPDPIAVGVNAMGEQMRWLRPIIKIAAIAGLSSVVLVLLMAQPRIFYSMAKDGLLPPLFEKVHPKYKTPYISSMITGVVAMIVCGVTPINVLGELVSIGTLFAFAVVCASVIYLRKTRKRIPRPFKTPLVPWIPLAGVLVCLLQMLALPLGTWLRLVSWLFIGIIIYVFYGRINSKLSKTE